MDAQTAADGLAGLYHVLSDLGGLIAGLLALLAGLMAYAAGRHQARIGRAASEAQIAALRDQVKELQRSREAEEARRREDLRFALACEATRIAELVAHRYRIIPVEYGPGRLETIARSACDIFKVEPPSVLRAAGASQLLDKDAIAAAALLEEAIEEVNSLLAVEGALGRLPAVELMTAYENATEAAKRLRALTSNNGTAEPIPHAPRRVADLVGAAAQ